MELRNFVRVEVVAEVALMLAAAEVEGAKMGSDPLMQQKQHRHLTASVEVEFEAEVAEAVGLVDREVIIDQRW